MVKIVFGLLLGIIGLIANIVDLDIEDVEIEVFR